jgi:CheY-like chemotaxis protein
MKEVNVLIVDDDQAMLAMLANMIKGLHLNPLTAVDGTDGLEKVKTSKVDLIITDLMMPNMDGFEFIKKIRQINANIPVAVISGHGDVNNVVSALSHGAYNFITKPFTIKEIENVIKRGLRLREFSLGTHRLQEGIKNITEIEIPNYSHLLASAALYVVRECQWRGIEDEMFLSNISICLDELLNNAFAHGNQMDESKKILLRAVFDSEKLSITIEDEGQGFDCTALTGEFAETTSTLPDKRGIFIVKYLMDEVFFNEKGTSITMVKYISAERKRVLH